MEWTEINGTLMRYDLRPGDGPCYVLLHEMGGSVESWDDVLQGLPAGACVLRYDMRGAVLSEKLTEAWSVDTLAEDLHGLLDHLGVTAPVVLAGVAVGAGVAIRFAALWPQRVSHLVAMAPACGVAASAIEGGLQRARSIAQHGMRAEGMAVFERAYPLELRTDEQRYQRYRARWLSADARSLGAIYEMLVRMDVSEDLRHITARTVLVGGDFDALRPPAEIARLASLAPDVEAIQVASGHFMTVNSPHWVAYLISRFATSDAPAQCLYDTFKNEPGNVVGTPAHVR